MFENFAIIGEILSQDLWFRPENSRSRLGNFENYKKSWISP